MDGGKERVGCAGVERESSGMIAITNFVSFSQMDKLPGKGA
jgi:hypothetical protein